MINLKDIEANPDLYKEGLMKRGLEPQILDELIKAYAQRRQIITETQLLQNNHKQLSDDFRKLKQANKDTTQIEIDIRLLKDKIEKNESHQGQIVTQLTHWSFLIPNKPHQSVTAGKNEKDNKIISVVGEPTKLNFIAKEHFDLGEKLGIIDFDRATKTTGTRFSFLKGKGARLERALIQLMMDIHSNEHGYTEMIPPFIVNTKSMIGTGQFPKFTKDVFQLTNTDYYLIPTAEVPVTNYYSDEVLKETDLPKSFCAYSPCFRSEAGSAGRDTKGLIRQHQFDKVELMTFCHPKESYEVHEKLTAHAEKILQLLELPYRKSLLCAGDMGFSSAKTYDLEVWLPGQNTYREISSCSNFEDFQARRANIRFKPQDGGKPQFVHTLNGSGLAVGRTLVALLENGQQEDGSIILPEILKPYMGGSKIIK